MVVSTVTEPNASPVKSDTISTLEHVLSAQCLFLAAASVYHLLIVSNVNLFSIFKPTHVYPAVHRSLDALSAATMQPVWLVMVDTISTTVFVNHAPTLKVV